MRKHYFLVAMIYVGLVSFITYAVTHSFFSDSAGSVNNTFAAAQTFPTAIPSVTNTPTPTLIPTVTITPTVTPTPTGIQIAAGDVVINEIMWMGTQGNAADEWIELRNMTGNPINISGWVVDNLGSGVTINIVIPAAQTIPANGFYMIANDTRATGAHDVDPDLIANVSLLNPGEQLILRTSAGGTVIDTANVAGDWFAGDAGGGQTPERSMERNAVPGNGTVGTNWHTASTAVNMDSDTREIATPKATNSL